MGSLLIVIWGEYMGVMGVIYMGLLGGLNPSPDLLAYFLPLFVHLLGCQVAEYIFCDVLREAGYI